MIQTTDTAVGIFKVQLRPHNATDPMHREHGRLSVRTATAEALTPGQQVRLLGALGLYLTPKKLTRVRELAQTNGGHGWQGVGLKVDARGALLDIDPGDFEDLVAQLEQIEA